MEGLRKFISWLLIAVAVIAVFCAICCLFNDGVFNLASLGSWVPNCLNASLSWWQWLLIAAVALIFAAMVHPESVESLFDNLRDAVHTVGAGVGGAVSAVISGLASGLSESPLLWIGMAVLGIYLLTRGDDDSSPKVQVLPVQAGG